MRHLKTKRSRLLAGAVFVAGLALCLQAEDAEQVAVKGTINGEQSAEANANIEKYGWQENWGERAAWSRRVIRRNTGAYGGYLDMFDLTDAQKLSARSYPIECYENPGVIVDQSKAFAGKVVFLVQLTPNTDQYFSENFYRTFMTGYMRLHKEFSGRDDVVFLPVWLDSSKDMAGRRKTLATFLKKYGVPGPVYLAAKDFSKKKKNNYSGGPAMCPGSAGPKIEIRDKTGNLVFRESRSSFLADSYRLMMKRILEPEFNEQVRGEFPSQPRHFPVVEKSDEGLIYSDDFESYKDHFALKLSPRWGFHYDTQYRIDSRPEIVEQVGMDNSTAARIQADYMRGPHEGLVQSNWRNNLEHDLPVPLRDGYLSFNLNATSLSQKRAISEQEKELSEYKKYDSKINTDLIVMFRQPKSIVPAGYLLIKNNSFVLIDENPHIRDIAELGDVKFTPGRKWYNIEIKVSPDSNAEVFVDGVSIGKLQSTSLLGFTLRCRPVSAGWGGSNTPGARFHLDNAEVFYRGDPTKLLADHAAYIKASKTVHVGEPIYPKLTKAQKDAFEYDTASFGQIGRKDVYFHGPRKPNGSLVMERVFKPGTYVTLPNDHKGEVIMMHVSQELPPVNALRRTFKSSAVAVEPRKLTMTDFGDKAVIYNRTSPYGEWCRSSYEDYRELRVEQRVAKRAVRKMFGRAVFWEVDDCVPEDNNVMFDFSNDHFDAFCRIDGRKSLWGGGHGSLPPNVMGFIMNSDGKLHMKLTGEYMYHEGQWLGMKVALNEDFKKSVIRDFSEGSPIVKSRHLPIIKKTPQGLSYRENFESYADDSDLRTAPCWGFSYTQMQPAVRGYIRHRNELGEGEGRSGSNALLVDASHVYDRVADAGVVRGTRKHTETKRPNQMVHMFGQPLKKGTFSFYLRQGPKSHKRGGYAFAYRKRGVGNEGWFGIDLLDETEEIIDAIITSAETPVSWDTSLRLEKANAGKASIAVKKWHANEFAGAFPDDKTWHQVKVVVAPGQKVEVFVDDKSIGKLEKETFSGIRIDVFHGESMYIDDAELFCEGNADDLEKEYTEAMKNDMPRREAKWAARAQEIIDNSGWERHWKPGMKKLKAYNYKKR